MGRTIEENVERRLYAESMGMCMNPKCRCELFRKNGDIIERAHIVPYCKTADNSFENLVVLCPNCHTDFDKNHAFTGEEILSWKKIRREELERFFIKKFATFEELKNEVFPLLLENKGIYENYYLKGNRELWDLFECKILANNRKLELLFSKNLSLIQHYEWADWDSNLACVNTFLNHVKEFEATRDAKEKVREVLFPAEINSIFGIEPVEGSMLPSTESLEFLIQQLKTQNKFQKIVLGVDRPYIIIKENEKLVKIFLDDTPQIRQLYYNYNCFKETGVRLKSLNFALRRINLNKLQYKFLDDCNLREILLRGKKIIFVYEYCLSRANLEQLCPEENSIVVNLHNWNGKGCISGQAYELAHSINVKLLTQEEFFKYLHEIK